MAQARDMNEDIMSGRCLVSQAEHTVRAGFVRKVYSILAVQIAVTTIIAAPIAMMPASSIQGMVWLFYLASVLSLGVLIGVTCCCQQVARTFPQNYIFLFTITICESIIVGFVSSLYDMPSVILAAALTTGIFLGLTAYACFSKTDFTGMGPYLFAALLGLFFFGLILMFVPGENMFMRKVYAGIGAIVFSFYIIMDTQMIVGGRHTKHQFDIDDYVFAALNIYLDIINLFMFLLQIFGNRN